MIIVDTTIWIDHLARTDDRLVDLIENDRVLVHPFVTGEIMLGSVANRLQVAVLLDEMPQVLPSRHVEVMLLIENSNLGGSGVGYVDLHLLAAALQRTECQLWTRDRRLRRAAERLGVNAAD